MNPAGTGASFRKRKTWATLVATVVIFGGALSMTLVDPTNASRSAWLLLGATSLQILVLLVLRITFAMCTDPEPNDERDTAIVLRSLCVSRPILAAGILLAIFTVFVQQSVGTGSLADPWGSPMLVGHLLLWSFVASEIARLATKAVGYRAA